MAALGSAALAQTPARGQTAATRKYTGALDGFESKVNPPDFDPVEWTRKRYESMPRKLAFKAANRKQAEAWQKKLHAKLVELVGGFPSERTPLSPQTLEVKDYPNYRREKFVITTRPGVALLGYLLTPKQRSGPYAPMICLPGHGRGVDDIVGIDAEGRDRTNKDGYQHDFAIQAVEHGMAAVALEQMAFGCRRGVEARNRNLGNSSCQPTAGAAMLFGETMVGWRVWDVMRAVDWIETRPELDAKRVGCMGISGGGTVTVFASALEPRIKLAFVSGYLNTFRDSILSLSHCIDNYVPGILQWAEMYDVAGLIAPRPLFIESGEKDRIFPIAASIESYQKVKQIYEVFGAGDRVQQEVFPAEHLFHGVGGLRFAARHMVG
jgi:dienelactone hydrolase